MVEAELHTLLTTSWPLKSSNKTTGVCGEVVTLDVAAAAVRAASFLISQGMAFCWALTLAGVIFFSFSMIVFLQAVKKKRVEMMIPERYLLMVYVWG